MIAVKWYNKVINLRYFIKYAHCASIKERTKTAQPLIMIHQTFHKHLYWTFKKT